MIIMNLISSDAIKAGVHQHVSISTRNIRNKVLNSSSFWSETLYASAYVVYAYARVKSSPLKDEE